MKSRLTFILLTFIGTVCSLHFNRNPISVNNIFRSFDISAFLNEKFNFVPPNTPNSEIGRGEFHPERRIIPISLIGSSNSTCSNHHLNTRKDYQKNTLCQNQKRRQHSANGGTKKHVIAKVYWYFSCRHY